MNRNINTRTFDSLQLPTLGFDEFAEFLATDSFQTAISITLSFSDIEIS